MKSLLSTTSDYAAAYLASLHERSVIPRDEAIAGLQQLDGPLPEHSSAPAQVMRQLHALGGPATVASAGGRYFGFVTGGSLPSALAASWLASAWDQNGCLAVMSPVSAKLEQITQNWLVELLQLPPGTVCGFGTGATMANFTALAAARHALLKRAGWDVEADGLFGAPPLKVVVGEEVHVSLLKALSLLGLGRERVIRVAADTQGRMRADALPELDDKTIVCIQAGNVNSGAFDPAAQIAAAAQPAGAWVHVDGAFGLWAAATPGLTHLTTGLDLADSWATDAHKWLNVPYDSGLVFCRQPELLQAAMAASAANLVQGDSREPCHYVPEMSRRARAIEIWAALSSLGRSGVAALIERCCRHARRFAEGLQAAGYEILNDVVLNQVMVTFGADDKTTRVIAGVQKEGTCWCGGTVWHGRAAMRISVSSWATTDDDVERSLAAIITVAEQT
jgi:glutamate/tyrosine decarboxylase-like PLP-dependent enzyme